MLWQVRQGRLGCFLPDGRLFQTEVMADPGGALPTSSHDYRALSLTPPVQAACFVHSQLSSYSGEKKSRSRPHSHSGVCVGGALRAPGVAIQTVWKGMKERSPSGHSLCREEGKQRMLVLTLKSAAIGLLSLFCRGDSNNLRVCWAS